MRAKQSTTRGQPGKSCHASQRSPNRQKATAERFRLYTEALGHTLDSYERENPNWFADTVMELIGNGLRSLRQLLENPRDKEVTWDSPIVELHYPVGWNWEAWKSGEPGAVLQTCGQLTTKDLCFRKKAVRKLVSIAIQVRNVFVLNALTKNVAWEKRRNRWRPILPSEIAGALGKMSPRRQQRTLDNLYRPFSIGTFGLDCNLEGIRNGDPVPTHVTRALTTGMQAMDIPPLTFSGTTGDTPFKFSLIVQFRPFVVDLSTRQAYFPIVIGLVFHPDSVALAEDEDGRAMLVPDASNPGSWSKKDRTQFWETLLDEWKRASTLNGRRSRSDGKSTRDAVVELMVSAKIALPDHQRGAEILNSVVNLLHKHGRVDNLKCDYAEVIARDNATQSRTARNAMPDRFDVFLAHNSKDKPFVAKVADHLRRRGLIPWIDKDQIPPGRRFQRHLQDAITKVSAAAVFIGRNGVGPWEDMELESFVKRCVKEGLPVIPVLLPGRAQIPRRLPFLSSLNFIRFRRNAGERAVLDQLAWGITGQKPARALSDRKSNGM